MEPVSFNKIHAKVLESDEYKTHRNIIFDKFSDFENLSEEERWKIWSWFINYIQSINWPRAFASTIFGELNRVDAIYALWESELDTFSSVLYEDGIPDIRCMSFRFKDEPEDYYERHDYVNNHSKWMNPYFVFDR